MKIWTFQSKDVAEKIESLKYGEVYLCDPEKSSSTTFAQHAMFAYAWMAKKVAVKTGLIRSEDELPPVLPVWGWYIYHGKNECPDVLDGPFNAGAETACIELEIPEEFIVLSDVNMWYEPLVDRPCLSGLPEKEKKEYIKEYTKAKSDREKDALLERTWERVLEMHPEKYPFFNNEALPFPMMEYYDVQAAFAGITYRFVRNIEYDFGRNHGFAKVSVPERLNI